jgi:hypothetical protein
VGPTRQGRLAEIITYLGSIIIIIGLGIFISQHWATLNQTTRILMTLGSGMAAYSTGVLLHQTKNIRVVSQAFFLISAILMPLGLSITLHELNSDTVMGMLQTKVSGLMFSVYLLSFYLFRRTLFIVFSILFGSWFFMCFTNELIHNAPLFLPMQFNLYRFFGLGVTYVLLGAYFSQTNYQGMSGLLFSFGSFCALGSALSLGGWYPSQNAFWELSYPLLTFSAIYGSVFLKSKGLLINGAFFLMIFIMKITSAYFSKTVGWPLALVGAGFLFIGVGFYTYYLNKKYLQA